METLPLDLVLSIALCLPLPALVTFRRIRKRWLSLLTSESFCRQHYSRHCPPEMKIETPPTGMRWSEVHRRLPLLVHVAPILSDCCRFWPQLIQDQNTHAPDRFPIELWEKGLEDDPPFVGLFPKGPGTFVLKRYIDCTPVQKLEFSDRELYSVLLHLFLDGGRARGLEVPVGTLFRLCICLHAEMKQYAL